MGKIFSKKFLVLGGLALSMLVLTGCINQQKVADVLTNEDAPVVDGQNQNLDGEMIDNVRVIKVDGYNFAFSQDEIRVKKGDRVKIEFTNTQGFHDWVVDEFDGAATAKINTGQIDTIEFVADKAGVFEYYCSVGQHRAMGMFGQLIVEDDELMMESGANANSDETGQAGVDIDLSGDINFNGTVLAGSQSKLIDFNQADYELALNSDKLVFLYFYATWCPSCVVEEKALKEAFNELNSDQVVGFRVNYKDNDTDKNEEELAREYGIAYQHTKVAIKNGSRVLKAPDTWSKDRYITEINKLLN